VRQWRGEILTGVGGMGDTMKLTSGAHVAVTEGKAKPPDCANSKKRRLLAITPRPRKPGWAERTCTARGRRRGTGESGWAERPDGPTGRWAVLG
jgi:hypothetical protein